MGRIVVAATTPGPVGNDAWRGKWSCEQTQGQRFALLLLHYFGYSGICFAHPVHARTMSGASRVKPAIHELVRVRRRAQTRRDNCEAFGEDSGED